MLTLDSVRSLAALLSQAAHSHGHLTALRTAEHSHTYASLAEAAGRIQSALHQSGLRPQQRVGYLGVNSARCVELMFGTLYANGIWTPLNWRLSKDVMKASIAETDMAILFADSTLAPPASELVNCFGKTVAIIAIDMGKMDFETWLAKADGIPPDPVAIDTGDIAVQIYTSGTSGLPKGVMLSHEALIASRAMERQVDQPWSSWQPGDINLVCMPNFHVSGALSVVAGLVNLGCTVLLPQFEVGAMLEVLRTTPPTRLLLVPSAIKLLLDDPRSADVDFSTIHYVMYGGSPMPEPLMQEILGRMKCEFVQFYGMTETSGRATYLPPECHRPGPGQRLSSAGKPFPGVQIEIHDEAGARLATRQIGEICVQSPSVMKGYWARPDATAGALLDGWYKTGDVGYLDEEGYLFVVDRLNDKIVSGGENVYPSEVEAALRSHVAVADAAVFARPDPRWIEAIHAAVILAPNASVTEADLRNWVADKVGSYKAPKRVWFVDTFPRGATGKVLRKDLARQFD